MFGRNQSKQRLIDQLSALLGECEAENRMLRRQAEELDMRNARLRQQVHLMRLGAHPDLGAADPIVAAEQFGQVESRFGFVVADRAIGGEH